MQEKQWRLAKNEAWCNHDFFNSEKKKKQSFILNFSFTNTDKEKFY